MKGTKSFNETLNDAFNDLSLHGFDSAARVEFWAQKIREAARGAMASPDQMDKWVRAGLGAVYKRLVDNGELLRMNKGVSRYTLEKVKPKLRGELDRRMAMSRSLIKLNRDKVIEEEVQRWTGWASSIPAGGSSQIDKKEEKDKLKASLASLPFKERRVLIDQGHKMTASLNEIVAVGGGALAGIWHSQWRRPDYDYREDHKERDKQLFVVRGNWAMEKGLMKLDGHKYTDEITKPGEEIFCSCNYSWIYNLSSLPESMLTAKGKEELARVRKEIAR